MNDAFPQTVDRLVEAFPRLSPQLQKAARFFLDHPEEVGLNSMRTVAAQAGVRPATISRLCRALGYSNYEEFRGPFRQRLRRSPPGFSERFEELQRRGAGHEQALFEELRRQELENVSASLSDDVLPKLRRAVEILWSSRRIYVLGLRGAFAPAFLFHYVNQLFHDRCQLLDTRAGVFADQLRGLDSQDAMLVISFPPYTQLTIDAVDYAAEARARIIAITDSLTSPAARAARETVVAQNASPSFYHSFTGVIAICQTLIGLLVARAEVDSVKVVQEAEKQLARVSAYW